MFFFLNYPFELRKVSLKGGNSTRGIGSLVFDSFFLELRLLRAPPVDFSRSNALKELSAALPRTAPCRDNQSSFLQVLGLFFLSMSLK